MSWVILNGQPFQTEAAELITEPMLEPFPLSYFRFSDGNIINGFEYFKIEGNAMKQVYPKTYWRLKKYVNEGLPYNEMFPDIPYTEPVFRYDLIRLLDNVRVVSHPHGLDRTFPVTKMVIPLDKPEDTKYTLNTSTSSSLTASIAQGNSELIKQIRSGPTLTTVLASAKENATELIKSASGGYVTLRRNETGAITEILISDEADYTKAQRIWRWNINGLGYSNTGYSGEFGLAMTMDGAIVADYITAGHMFADRIDGGILTMGGIDNVNGIIRVKDGDGKVVSQFDSTGGYVHGTLENINTTDDVILRLKDGKISSIQNVNGSMQETAYINSTYVYEGGTKPTIDLYGEGIVFHQKWLGISGEQDTTVYTTQKAAEVEYVSNITQNSDGTISVEKKSARFLHGILVSGDYPEWEYSKDSPDASK